MEQVSWHPVPTYWGSRAQPGGDGTWRDYKRFATEAHPFSALPDLDNFRKRIVAYQGLPDETILRERQRALEYWTARAQALRSKSLSRFFGVTDCDLRDYHFKDCPSGLNSPVGTCCHLELWQEMVEASGLPDRKFVESLVQGFPLMGPMQESDCWPKLDPSHPPELLEADLHTRAWDIRKKLIDKVRREKGGLAAEVWKDSLSDVDKGFSMGRFYHSEQLKRKARDGTVDPNAQVRHQAGVQGACGRRRQRVRLQC